MVKRKNNVKSNRVRSSFAKCEETKKKST